MWKQATGVERCRFWAENRENCDSRHFYSFKAHGNVNQFQ